MYFKYKDYNIYYEVHGKGDPIVFLNGIMMSTKSWGEFIEPLTKNNQLILVDMLGQGQSSKEFNQFYHDVQVEIVEALFNHLNLDKANVFGISYGGEIALQFVLKYPHRVKKMFLSNTCPNTSYWLEEVGNAWNQASIDGLSYYLTTIPVIYSPKFFVENREWMERRKKLLVPIFNDQDFIASMRVLTNSSVGYDVRDRLHEIDVSTMILSCEYDFVTPNYQQKELHENIRGSQLLFVPDSGHGIMYEKPALFVSSILGFFNNSKDVYNL